MKWNSKYPVHLQPEDINFWVFDGELSPVCDDFFSKVSAQKLNLWKNNYVGNTHLKTRPAEESLVWKPCPKISVNPL